MFTRNFLPNVCVAASLLVATLNLAVKAEYTPPTYPQTQPAVERIALQAPDQAQAGTAIEVTLQVVARSKPATPCRPFLHVAREGAAYVVVTLPEVAPDKVVPGQPAEAGTVEAMLPADLPTGQYKLIAGVYLESAVAEKTIQITGPRDVPPPLIINTGTFTDKFGTPHRWYVNRAHTLFWDGVPFIPVGGMMIPDDNFDTFKAQIDLLVRNNVRDIYWNVGNSVQMPHTWESKPDERIRYFQKCIDYMDEVGMRYGMEFSGLQAHGYGYEIMGGKEIAFTIRKNDKGDAEPRMERQNDDEWLKDGEIFAAYRKIKDAFYLIRETATGKVLASGKIDIAHDERKNREGKDRGQEEQVVRFKPPTLPPGEYRLCLSVSQYHDSWNANMHYWGEDTAKYYKAIRDLYGKVRMGPGFRFVVDAFWNENNFNHGIIPAEEEFRTRHAKYLQTRYGTIEKLRKAWAIDEQGATIEDFASAADCLPLRGIEDQATHTSWDYLLNVKTQKLIRVRSSTSQHRYDLLESVGKQVRDFHIEVADLISGLFDVPVVFKFFSGMDTWHINDAGITGGHDGVGMETYGLGEPQLTFMGIPALSSCEQSTKTMWLLVTEVGEGTHQDQALARNKMMGCTSRLGTMYPMYASLLGGGAKGIYHYYMVPSPGADRFWEDSTMRDPRQLEWMGTFARIVENAPQLIDYMPKVCYRWPALYQPNSGLLFSDPHRDYFNTDCLWWVDPAGKLPNGEWLLPTFKLDVPTDLMFINLENAPATRRWANEVDAFLAKARKTGERVTWLGYRRDLGTIPAIDKYYTNEFAKDDDGVEVQVLKPAGDCKVVAANKAGQVWNLTVGNLQIISKNAENKTGWRPDRVVLDGKTYRYDYQTFMRDMLGAGLPEFTAEPFESISFIDGQERVTVVSLAPPYDNTIRVSPHLPAWSLEAFPTPVAASAIKDYALDLQLPANSTVAYVGGEQIQPSPTGTTSVTLRPDELTLTTSEGKIPWAREGLVFNTLNSHAGVIVRSPASERPVEATIFKPASSASAPQAICIEAERPATSNFNLDTFSGLGGCSDYGLLGLATAVTPPTPDGYFATYDFEVKEAGTYALRVREGYLAVASPGRWRIDGGAWREATNSYVPQDIKVVALYNALEDERMIFATYNYGTIDLSAGKHTFTYSVIARRPGGLDIGLENSTPYGKLLDCFTFVKVSATTPLAASRSSSPLDAQVRINLVANPSCEQDTGGWTATEWTGDRWKYVELHDDRGWDRDFWWTKKVGAEGRIFIDKLMDLGGLTVRQSYAGVRSLRIRAGEQPRRFSSEPVAIKAAGPMHFGGYVRTEMMHAKAQIKLRLIDGDGRECGTFTTTTMTADTHWTQYDAVANVPDNARMAILDCCVEGGKPNLSRFGRDWRDTAWFDDLYVYREAAADH
jgi:hypothetical protein